MKILTAALALTAVLCGCIVATAQNRTAGNTPAEAAAGNAAQQANDPAQGDEFTKFYMSLPEFSLPTDRDYTSDHFDKMVEVPESLLDMFPTYGMPTWAVRLPEIDCEPVPEKGITERGYRFILTEYRQENEEHVTVLCSFRADDMTPVDHIELSGIREIDGGNNILVTSFEIDEHYEVTVRSVYSGTGAGDKHVEIVLQEVLVTPRAGGEFLWVGDQTRRITKYEETALQRFTVRSYLPCFDEETNKWTEKDKEVRYYMVNDESQFVEVEEFPGPAADTNK